MGDRGNIVVNGVYLYTHSYGTELRTILARALVRGKDRWTDDSYLTRIVFCEMLKASGKGSIDDTTGFGISTQQQDWNNPNLVVDADAQTVSVVSVRDDGKKGTTSERKTFEDWIEKYLNAKLPENEYLDIADDWDTADDDDGDA